MPLVVYGVLAVGIDLLRVLVALVRGLTLLTRPGRLFIRERLLPLGSSGTLLGLGLGAVGPRRAHACLLAMLARLDPLRVLPVVAPALGEQGNQRDDHDRPYDDRDDHTSVHTGSLSSGCLPFHRRATRMRHLPNASPR